MYFVYRIVIEIVPSVLRIFSYFNPKLSQALRGRRSLWRTIEDHYRTVDQTRKRIIIHVASFGELEQAKPIIKQLKINDPTVHIHLTFFSPSGYENAIGKYSDPDLITYLPFDTRKNVVCFLNVTKPDLFVFVRYDVWHNLADELYKRDIKSLLICATLDKRRIENPLVKQLYHTTYSKLDHILAIRESDCDALSTLGINAEKIEVAGDTRFDQVRARKILCEMLPDIVPEEIRNADHPTYKPVIVAGSTWEEDEKMIADIDHSKIRLVVVPHEVHPAHISLLQKRFSDSILYSEIDLFAGESVIIVDSIGKLFHLYKYATLTYVGGGFGAGVHNVLEAAVWGVPVLCGPNHRRSREIEELADEGGAFIVHNGKNLQDRISYLFDPVERLIESANKARLFVEDDNRTTDKMVDQIEDFLKII